MNIVIIGGGTAGSNLALELRKIDKSCKIIVIEESKYLEYSCCALPYVISGEIKSFDKIFITDKKFYKDNNIEFKNNCKVININRKNKEIEYIKNKEKKKLKYDKLVIATGSRVFIPPIKGLNKTNFLTFKNIDDAKRIDKKIEKNKNVVIIGGGAIGVEIAYSIAKRGAKVTIIEAKDRLASISLDSDMACILENYLESNGIKIIKNSVIEEIKRKELIVNNNKIKFELLIISTGFKANIELAKKIGIKVNRGIIVNEFLQTSDKNIYACGDCIEVKHFITNNLVMSQFATSALREIKVLAKNLIGKKIKFEPVLNNHISKVGKIYYGSTGITEEFGKKLGLKIVSTKYKTRTRPDYYSKGKEIMIKLICNLKGKILGAQLIGYENFADKLNLITFGIKKGFNLDDLIHGEYCYNPCISNPINELAIVAEICKKKLELKNAT